MKKYLICIIILLLIVLTGCDSNNIKHHNYYFYGENDDWFSAIEYDDREIFTKHRNDDLEYENEYQLKLSVIYKGELSDLANIKRFEFGYETWHRSSKQGINYDEGESPTQLSYSLNSVGNNDTLIKKDDEIPVTISIDGITQVINLKTK